MIPSYQSYGSGLRILSNDPNTRGKPKLEAGASMIPSYEAYDSGVKPLSNDPPTQGKSKATPSGNNSDESSTYSKSGSDHSKEDVVDRSPPTHGSLTAPAPRTVAFPPAETSLMSWWPESDNTLIPEASWARESDHKDVSISRQAEADQKGLSLLKRLEKSLGHLFLGDDGHGVSIRSLNGVREVKTPNVRSKVSAPSLEAFVEPESLFHVMLTSSHFKHDVNSIVQGVCVCGTYTSLRAAKAAAHRALFDAGYEREWFASYEAQQGKGILGHDNGAMVQAVGPDGDMFTVSIAVTPNLFNLKPNEAGKIQVPLYHVVQTIVHYHSDESGQTRDTSVQGSFQTYNEARKAALSLLLCEEDGIDRSQYAEYDEAAPGELDCGYGENVLVHAAGQMGENFLVSVLKGQELESVRVREAASYIDRNEMY